MFQNSTPGGSPIFYNVGGRNHGYKSRVLYACSADERHKLTKNQARSNGYRCSMCGADLKVRKQIIEQISAEAKRLGFKLVDISSQVEYSVSR